MSRAGLAAFVLLLLASSAPAEPTAANRQRAGELATESAKHYKLGEYEVSVALLRKAYALYPEPNLLYNLARALEGMGDKRGAVEQYNQYLATAKRIEDRGAIKRRVALLERELANTATPASDNAVVVAKPPETAQPLPQEPLSPPLDAPLADPFAPLPPEDVTPASKLPLIPIAVGAAAIGAGITFGLRARDFEKSAKNEPVGLDASEDYADAVSNARTANILFIGGGAVLAAGIVWEIYVLRAQRKKSDAVVVRPTMNGRGIALEWSLP